MKIAALKSGVDFSVKQLVRDILKSIPEIRKRAEGQIKSCNLTLQACVLLKKGRYSHICRYDVQLKFYLILSATSERSHMHFEKYVPARNCHEA